MHQHPLAGGKDLKMNAELLQSIQKGKGLKSEYALLERLYHIDAAANPIHLNPLSVVD